jgi:hypothetical protein
MVEPHDTKNVALDREQGDDTSQPAKSMDASEVATEAVSTTPGTEKATRKFLRLCIDNAAVIIAVSSLFAATFAAYATYRQADIAARAFELDSQHRELSLQPKLNFEIDTERLELRITNSGRGPAVITAVKFQINDLKFEASSEINDGRLGEFTINNLQQVINYLFSGLDVFRQTIDGDKRTVFFHRFALPQPNQHIQANESFVIFNTRQKDWDAFLEKSSLIEVKQEAFNQMIRQFARNTLPLLIDVHYCSVTRNTCNVLEVRNRNQKF